jgi:hypothetical protein
MTEGYWARYESLIDRQIRMAQERGDFDDLPGKGKPLAGLDGPDDENWWVRRFVEREGVPAEALLPTPLQLRKEAERLPETVRDLPTEEAVRAIVSELNRRIVEWLRAPSGPAVPLRPVNADEIVGTWRAANERRAASPAPDTKGGALPEREGADAPRQPWWRRLLRR